MRHRKQELQVTPPKKNLPKNIFSAVSFLAVYWYIIAVLLLPFFANNNLLNWDMSGMYFSSWYTANYLFPEPIGWNPYFFFGYPQNQFYGPLFPYIVSVISLFIPLDVAFKLVLSASLLITPFSFHYFARSCGFKDGAAAAVMLAMFSLLFLFPVGNFGGDLHSTFNVGLVANSMALPLFFFYLGSLWRARETGGVLLPSAIFSLLLLAHPFTGVVASLALPAYLARYRDRKIIFFVLKHAALVLLLTGFWLVPGIAKHEYLAVERIGGLMDNLPMFLGAVALLGVSLLCRKEGIDSLKFFLASVLGFAMIGALVGLTIHYYRFTTFFALLAPVILLSFFREGDRRVHLTVLLFSILAIATTSGIHSEGTSIIKQLPKLPEGTAGRVWVDAPPYAQSNFHELQHIIPMQWRVHSARGLYVDSSLQSKYVFDLEAEIDANNITWGISTDRPRIIRIQEKMRNLIPYQLRLFGVSNVVSPSPIFAEWADTNSWLFTIYTQDKNKEMEGIVKAHPYYLYSLGKAPLAEVLSREPVVVDKAGWRTEVTNWFLSERVRDTILVDEQVPGNVGTGRETVEVLEESARQDYIRFKVGSDKAVPVLIRISQFPNWRAYEGEKELHIYRASPYFMLVYGKGEVELRYMDTWSDTLGKAMTAAGIFIVTGMLLLRRYPKNRDGKKTFKDPPEKYDAAF